MERKENIKRVKTVWRFAKPYFGLFVIAEICILLIYTISLVLPLNLKTLTDEVIFNRNQKIFGQVVVNYIALFAASFIINMIYAYVWKLLDNRYVVDVKNAVYSKTLSAKPSFLSNMNSGEIISRIDWDADQFIHIIQRNLFHFVNSILLCIGILIIVGRYHWIFAIVLIVAAALPVLTTYFLSKHVNKYTREKREAAGEFTGKLFEMLKGMREIRILGAQRWANNTLFKRMKKIIISNNKISGMNFLSGKVSYLLSLLSSLLIYYIAVYLIYGDMFTIGMFLAVMEYVALLHRKFDWILTIYLDWNGRKVNVDRVNHVLDKESEDNSGEEINNTITELSFNNVTFAYDQKNILNNVSFDIKQGEKVAIIGPSGVGKTTIVGLILKFFEPQSGEVLINQINIQNIKYEDIRKRIGVVQQDIMLFDDTIKNNLLFGNDGISDEEIYAACDKVGLLEYIESLPDKINTFIDSRNHNLSGGQKQRLMIARVLLRKTDVLIFDEATSALDVESEEKIAEQIQSIDGITTIIISHRYNTIRNCDKVILLKNGYIDCIGTFDEVAENSELFSSLFGREDADKEDMA